MPDCLLDFQIPCVLVVYLVTDGVCRDSPAVMFTMRDVLKINPFSPYYDFYDSHVVPLIYN